MKKIIFLIVVSFSLGLNAQNLIISDDSTFSGTTGNALFEVYSANGNKGILIPRLTTAQRTAITVTNSDEGLVVYDTDTHSFWVWSNNQWKELGDKQTLTFNNSTGELTISNGNTVTIPLSSGGDNWGSQVVQTDGTTLSGDGTSANPLSVVGDLTDDQQLSLSGNMLSLTDGGSVDLSSFLDNTDDQTLSISGHTISIENGNSVTVPDNDNQTLTLTGNTLAISGGNSVDLSSYLDNTDNQTLTLSGNTLSISGGNSVDISSAAWSLTGNSISNGQFLGTTNNENLIIRTNNTDRWIVMRTTGYLGYGYDSTSIDYPISVRDGSASRVGSFISTETSSDNYGVYGACANTDWWGFGGYFTGGYVGLEAEVNPSGSNSYYGARTYVSGGSGSNYAIYGSAYSGQYGYGLYGYSSYASDYGYGTYGTSLGADSGNFGGYFLAYDAYPRAVYGSVTNDTGFGGYFSNFGDNGTGIVGVGQNISTFYYLTDGSGVDGCGATFGVYGKSTNTGDDTWGGYFEDGNGNYTYIGGRTGGTAYKVLGSGSNSTIIKDTKDKPVIMFSPEAPEILFQDYGSGQLKNGKTHIELDPTLVKNIYVDDKHPLRVFIQLEDNCKGVYVTNKTNHGFDVIELDGGTSNAKFSWTVVANRANSYDENGNIISKNLVRFPAAPGPAKSKSKKADKPQKPKVDPKAQKMEKH